MLERFLDLGSIDSLEEVLQATSVGEAIVVVHFNPAIDGDNTTDPKIAIVVEKKSKPSSKKTAGQRSIPGETKKVGERRIDNIRGGLAEICDDETLDRIRENLFVVETGLGHTLSNGNVVGLTALVYDGSLDIPFRPINIEEVGFGGWVSVNELLQAEGVREVAKDFLRASRDMGLISAALRDFKTDGLSAQLFPPGFSINQFFEQRESAGVDVKFTL